jgi:hypothetical protein
MITYKLVKVENLKLEKTVELTDKQLDVIYDALNYYTDIEDDVSDDIFEVIRKIHNLTKKEIV